MAERTVVEYKAGDLVRWHERYADGFMVRDVGDGVIVEKRDFHLDWMDVPYVNYTVYRTKHGDTMIFEEIELEPISRATHPVKMDMFTTGDNTND
jgi:hypothetical protein